MRLVRIALLTVLFFLIMGLVMAIGGPETGPAEKVIVGAGIVGLLLLAGWVGRLGRGLPSA